MSNAEVFFRVVKAQPGHPCAGLYAVERVYIRDNQIYKKELVHEWDLRLISEAILAKMGGSNAYETYKENHDPIEEIVEPQVVEAAARTKEDLKTLTQRKLNKELRGNE